MARFVFVLLFMAVLVASAAFAEDKQKRFIIDKITDTLIGQVRSASCVFLYEPFTKLRYLISKVLPTAALSD